ncbi:MAG: DUF4915 domain-containing protein [Pirellulales bacterium]|nr:DUF4915 domain-containing protein [Pirellulales bacterium]
MPTPTPRPLPPPPTLLPAEPIELRPYGDFIDWLAAAQGALAASTYNSGKVAFFSACDGALRATFWKLPRPMGLAVMGDCLAIALQQYICLYRLGAVSDPPPSKGGAREGIEPASSNCPSQQAALPQSSVDEPQPLRSYSESFEPQLLRCYPTGRLDAHDLALDRRGLLFANTRFNCIARPSQRVRFVRAWQPWFIAQPSPRDACHLNGVGVRDGRLAMATAFCPSDAPAAWRDGNRFTSGVLIDVRRGRLALDGLCMPHSPRWHDGCWWFCNSGEGILCSLNPGARRQRAIASLPGFTRGLAFAGGRAAVGLSRIRRRHILDAPPVRARWSRLQAGVALVDPATGAHTGGLEFVRGGREVYEVAFVERPQLSQPKL